MSYAVYCLLDLPVSASDDAVRAALRLRAKPGADTAELEAAVIAEHHDARELYEAVAAGRLSR